MPKIELIFAFGMIAGGFVWHWVLKAYTWHMNRVSDKALERARASGLLRVPTQALLSELSKRDTNDFLEEFHTEVARRESQRPPSSSNQ